MPTSPVCWPGQKAGSDTRHDGGVAGSRRSREAGVAPPDPKRERRAAHLQDPARPLRDGGRRPEGPSSTGQEGDVPGHQDLLQGGCGSRMDACGEAQHPVPRCLRAGLSGNPAQHRCPTPAHRGRGEERGSRASDRQYRRVAQRLRIRPRVHRKAGTGSCIGRLRGGVRSGAGHRRQGPYGEPADRDSRGPGGPATTTSIPASTKGWRVGSAKPEP